jgi:hypothetical protein
MSRECSFAQSFTSCTFRLFRDSMDFVIADCLENCSVVFHILVSLFKISNGTYLQPLVVLDVKSFLLIAVSSNCSSDIRILSLCSFPFLV